MRLPILFALLHSSLTKVENSIIQEGIRTSPKLYGTAASLTVHSVWHRARYGSRRVGGSRLRGWGGWVIHNDQHVTAALVGGNRAGVQLTADGDLEAKGSWSPPLLAPAAHGPRAYIRMCFSGLTTICLSCLASLLRVRPPALAPKKAACPHLLFFPWIPHVTPSIRQENSWKSKGYQVRTQSPLLWWRHLKGASPHWKGWAWLSPH